jgi:hypothetical protein
VRYRSLASIQPSAMVRGPSVRVSRAPTYSGSRLGRLRDARTGLSPPVAGLPRPFRFPLTMPLMAGPHPIKKMVWAPPLSLAATHGIDVNLSFPPGTKMFQFPGCRARPSETVGARPLRRAGCPIRRPSDRSSLPAPRGLSQVVASFIAFQCQGIHCTPLSI